MTVLRWGVLGASNFAATQMAPAIHVAKGAELLALGTSHPEKATRFLDFAPSIRVYETYEDVLGDSDIDVSIFPCPTICMLNGRSRRWRRVSTFYAKNP